MVLSLRIPLFTPKSIGIGAGKFSLLELRVVQKMMNVVNVKVMALQMVPVTVMAM